MIDLISYYFESILNLIAEYEMKNIVSIEKISPLRANIEIFYVTNDPSPWHLEGTNTCKKNFCTIFFLNKSIVYTFKIHRIKDM